LGSFLFVQHHGCQSFSEFKGSPEFLKLLREPKVGYRLRNRSSLASIVSQINLIC